VEYGYLDNTPSQIEPSSAVQYPSRDMFNVTAVAQPGLNNQRPSVYAASVVGGGSTINGMLFDRGAAEDYNNWAKLGNPGWDFAGLLPYFKKVRLRHKYMLI
jgi:choline dehydrogenase-like flavoprotein